MQKVTECLILSERSYCIFAPQGFVTKCFLIFIVEELCSQHLSQVGVLVTYWEPCINWLVMYWNLCIINQSCTGFVQKKQCSYIEEFKGSEAVKGFCCKFIYGDCRVQGQKFCTRSETSL